MSSFVAEINKIPPITRILCGSSFVVTLSVMMNIVPKYEVIYMWQLVANRFQIWRLYTTFFIGSSGIGYLFDLIMLYRNSEQLESLYFVRRRADYVWQLGMIAASILVLNIPLGSYIHSRPFLIALTYMTARVSPPGSQTSLFGLVTIPLIYFPFVLVFFDLLTYGPGVAASSMTGAIAAHLWWWLVWQPERGRAPAWLRAWIGNSDGNAGSGSAGSSSSGIQVIPPRRVREGASTTGHAWGSGNRLGAR